jgi:predicted P-loop ATPase
LLPPQLREYFYTKTNSGMVSKDDLLVLAQYGLVCWEELDSMLPKELNKLKAAMTMPSINERGAYERYHENRPHVASFCGTGNNVQFLSDTTGTRRWLPFEVKSIESPLATPFDYDGIFSQAYTLYKNGFRYWFDRSEIERLQQHNKAFETPQTANELIDDNFRKPVGIEGGDYLPASVILQRSGGVTMRELSAAAIGRALTAMGFEHKLVHGIRRYRVVSLTEAEKQLRRHLQGMGGEGVEVE